MRCGSVKVSKSCSAVVRNSCVSEREVTLIEGPLPACDVLVAFDEFGSSPCLATLELCRTRGVLKPDDGLLPGACWISLPCSVISAGASFCKRWRI